MRRKVSLAVFRPAWKVSRAVSVLWRARSAPARAVCSIARVYGPDGEPALLEIRNIRDGLAAINRHHLGCGQCSTTEWQRAVDRLVKAALDPSSACIEEARQALLELVNRPP